MVGGWLFPAVNDDVDRLCTWAPSCFVWKRHQEEQPKTKNPTKTKSFLEFISLFSKNLSTNEIKTSGAALRPFVANWSAPAKSSRAGNGVQMELVAAAVWICRPMLQCCHVELSDLNIRFMKLKLLQSRPASCLSNWIRLSCLSFWNIFAFWNILSFSFASHLHFSTSIQHFVIKRTNQFPVYIHFIFILSFRVSTNGNVRLNH